MTVWFGLSVVLLAFGRIVCASGGMATAVASGITSEPSFQDRHWDRPWTRRKISFINTCASGFARGFWNPLARCKDGASSKLVHVGRGDLTALEVMAPGATRDRIILYFHGGAHLLFSAQTHRDLGGRISAATRACVVLLNYRLAPANPFPAALDDAVDALRDLREQYPEASIAVGGDSAGGNLAFALLVRLAQLQLPQPVACFGYSPWLMMDSTDEVWRSEVSELVGEKKMSAWQRMADNAIAMYTQGHGLRDPQVSPVLAGAEIVKQFPPVLIHASDQEALCIEAKQMGERCSEAGVPFELKCYSGTVHVFQGFPLFFRQASQDSLTRLGLFLERHWAESSEIRIEEDA